MWIMPIFMPLYLLKHNVLGPIATFNAPDRRLTDKSTYRYAVVVMPMLTLIDWTHNFPEATGWIRAVSRRELFPLWTWLGQELLAQYARQGSTIYEDRFNNVKRDLPTIQKTIWALTAASAWAWQYMMWYSEQSLADLLLPTPIVLKQLTLETVTLALAEDAK